MKRKSNGRFPRKGKGFSYAYSDDKILEYSRWSTERKLRWLEEANQFVRRFASKKTKRLHKLFREGKI